MKISVVTLTGALAALFCIATSTHAADVDGVKYTLSLKAWQNTWLESKEEADGITYETDLGSTWMVGPAGAVTYKKLRLAASYLMALKEYEGEGFLSYDRKDIEIAAAFMLDPRFGIFITYKFIDSPASLQDGGGDYGSLEFRGPGLGATFTLPFWKIMAVYGNLAYLWMTREENTPESNLTSHQTGLYLEFGLACAITEKISAMIGFKGQNFDGEDSNGYYSSSDFTGMVMGFNYNF